MKHMVTLDYKLMLSLSLWQYNHHPDEGLTSGLFQKLSDRLTESTITKMDRIFQPEPLGYDRLFQGRGRKRTKIL